MSGTPKPQMDAAHLQVQTDLQSMNSQLFLEN